MEKNFRKNKGITLVALVVTIIILLILAGISIAQLTGKGLFEKAKKAREETLNAQDEENNVLGDYETEIAKIIGTNRNEENMQLKDCNIVISESGRITVQNVDKMIAFAVIQNGKCIDVTKNETYSLSVQINQTVEIYTIAIDENANLYKSNVVSYTGRGLYLYNKGDKCETITGGWNILTDKNATIDIDSYNYMELNSQNASYCMASICTQNAIDISNYKKLKMNVSVLSNGSTTEGYLIGIRESNAQTTYWDTFINATDKSTQVGEVINMELDISNSKGSCYIEVQNAQFLLKINKIWLE